jgi:hypothetical protein
MKQKNLPDARPQKGEGHIGRFFLADKKASEHKFADAFFLSFIFGVTRTGRFLKKRTKKVP